MTFSTCLQLLLLAQQPFVSMYCSDHGHKHIAGHNMPEGLQLSLTAVQWKECTSMHLLQDTCTYSEIHACIVGYMYV